MQGFDCKRINYGGLERGPVQMVMDYTTYLEIPEGCRHIERSTDFVGLYSWGITDSVLAALLADNLGAPTYLLEYSHEPSSGTPVANFQQLSWGPAEQAPSEIQIDSRQGSQGDSRSAARFYWPNGTGVIALDLAYDAQQIEFGDSYGFGTLQPPMKLASAFPTMFAGWAQWFSQESVAGTIYSWSDLNCEHPSGSH